MTQVSFDCCKSFLGVQKANSCIKLTVEVVPARVDGELEEQAPEVLDLELCKAEVAIGLVEVCHALPEGIDDGGVVGVLYYKLTAGQL